jgi:hypothetical protein
MDREHFEAMSIDELWALQAVVDQLLAARLKAEKRELEKRLAWLGRADGKKRAKNSPANQ